MMSTSYTRLKWNLVLIILGLSLVPLFALGYVIHAEFKQTYEEKLTSNLKLMVSNRRDAIDMFLNERVVQLRMLADMHSFAEMTDQAYLDAVFEVIHETSRSFIDVGVIGHDGRHEAYSGPFDLKEVNYKDESWFHQVMLKGLYISDVFMGFRNFPHFIIAVKRQEAGKTWILRATIDSDVFISLVRNVRTGKYGDAYIVNDKNQLQTPSRFGGKVLSKASIPDHKGGRDIEILEWSDGSSTFLAGTTPLANTDWRLVILENPEEGLSPLMRTKSLIYTLLGVCALVIFLGAYVTVSSVVAKLKASDRERAAMDAAVMQSSKMASLGKLAAGVAHEVNNPLSIIRESAGWIRDILNDGELGESKAVDELQEALADIDRHVERARKVTHRMLGFARRMEPLNEDVDLNMLANQTVAFLENETRHRNIQVDCRLDQELPLITTDSNQVQQVILNLLENAIDAIGENGAITVTTRVEGDMVAMDIADSGEGISRENLSKVFDPFFTTKPTGEGTGLGLSIVYSTLSKIGGTINVHSEQGLGTTFTVRLPFACPHFPGCKEEA
ncbi:MULTISPECIES: PAS domain-containing sensor histidine kinase [unclassified Pseudodesulfovibrio]|uniref:sensor histidine kinase n=1 Tax=unclassified Pseudodesulfovibrio TaxID=2661612 RepID=UPI000FEBA455|nr:MULTISPECIES: PAS domain-containing sensor histidine kinase [unclassified Pseudodesulfovibrio]MCJ2165580.1 ATP-binding protein [Pseudodesulfovibrio sp. S3-i]RWU02989.1 GHKL domain-containing protein [Pseudodesulfovibrio sp. S3]